MLIALVVFLVWGALRAQVALAGLMNGESIWSKAQKQAVIDLETYAVQGDSESLASFKRNYAILRHDRFVRDGSVSGDVPYEQLVDALGHGNALPETVPGVLFMLRHLPDAPYMREALVLWRSTDQPLDDLGEIAEELQQTYAAGKPSVAKRLEQRQRIQRINQYIEPRSNGFSEQVAKGATWLAQTLFLIVLGVAVFASILWFVMAKRILDGIRGTEERYRLLFDSAADAIVMIDDENDRILEANRLAQEWIGCADRNLTGQRFADLFTPERRGHAEPGGYRLLNSAEDCVRVVEVQSSNVVWGGRQVRQAIIRDVTERLAMRQTQRIASEAMANVAEGVVIVDAGRHVLSVNLAYSRMTGHTTKTLVDMRLEDGREMSDGAPLPAEIWDTVAREGNWLGEVTSTRADGSKFAELLSISAIRDGDGRVEHYVGVTTDVTGARADRRRLERLARHDALTNLLNRAAFVDQCELAIREAETTNKSVAVLFVDLDNFKIINDSYSHAIGDQLLVRVAERIRGELSRNDMAGRIGGDEFTVMAMRLDSREDVDPLARRLTAALSRPIEIDGHVVTRSASIGIAGYPLDGEDCVALIASADAAMYAAKQEQRNTHRYFSPLMQADARRRLKTVNDLREAIKEDQFRMVYQPSVLMRDRHIAGVEALLRWDHPERGEVMPDQFVQLAEQMGLAREVDEWVLNRVCAQIKAWDGVGYSHARVAVNISATWFGHEEFMQVIEDVVTRHGISPQSLIIEIVESTALHTGEHTAGNMRKLHELGVGVAIDDFGTGYSTLSYLKLPSVTYLKIDRSFVEGLPDSTDDAEIVRAILAISVNLGLIAIAEGVETRRQHDFLRGLGCREAQGYFYSRPLAAEEIAPLLDPKNAGRLRGIRLSVVPDPR